MNAPHPVTCRERFGVSDRDIERYCCNDLPAAERERIDALRQTRPDFAAYLVARQSEATAFLEAHPFAPIKAQLTQPAAPHRHVMAAARMWLKPMWGALATAAVIGVVASVTLLQRPQESGIRTRGAALAVEVMVRRPGQNRTFVTTPATVFQPGDQIRLQISTPQGGYLYLLSLNEERSFSVLLPDPNGSTQADASYLAPGTHVLAESWTLDDAPATEVLVVVVSQQRQPMAAMLQALEEQLLHTSGFPPALQAPAHSQLSIVALPKDAP